VVLIASAPYHQVLEQLLIPESEMARNSSGINMTRIRTELAE
jgi:hypothetical protein